MATVQNEIITSIATKHPDFFSSFKTNMQSGDIVKVESSIKNAVNMVYDAVHLDSNAVKSQLSSANISKIKNALPADFSELSSKDQIQAAQKDEIKDLYRNVFSFKTDGAEVQSTLVPQYAAPGTSVSVQTNTVIYVYIAGVIAAVEVLVLSIPLVQQTATVQALSNKDQLYKEDLVNSMTENFKAI